MKRNLLLKSYLKNVLAFIICLFLLNCQDRDDVLQENDQTAPAIYKDKIGNYWNQLKIGSDKEQLSQIEELSTAIDINSLKIYDLRTTEKLLVADAKSLQGLDGITKIIFYVNENQVVRSKIVTLKTNDNTTNYNKIIQSVVNADKNGFSYSGEITFLSLSKTKLQTNKYNQGKLIQSETLSPTRNRTATGKTQGSCVEYWWITRSGGQIISQVLLFIICDCSGGGGGVGEELSKMSNCDDGTKVFFGGSGSAPSSSYKPNLPANPVENHIVRHTDPDGVCTEYIYRIKDDGKSNWEILQVILPNIIIANNRDNYGILDYQFPVNNQKVFDPHTHMLYTYEQGPDSWIGIPATDKLIAETIEEKIDDSQLDACTKAVLAKLKNLQNADIASIFEKFGVPKNGTYNLKIVLGTPTSSTAVAETKLDGSKNNYVITIRDTYLNGTNNNNRPPTDLSIATVIIHEIIHAHFLALFDDFHNNGDICAYNNYDCLFMKYVSDNFEGTTDPHHSQMFENYIDIMANALQEFQTGIPVPETVKANLFYHDLAISTLTDTKIFKDRYPDEYTASNYAERRRITKNRITEDKNEATSDGEFKPKGKPCP